MAFLIIDVVLLNCRPRLLIVVVIPTFRRCLLRRLEKSETFSALLLRERRTKSNMDQTFVKKSNLYNETMFGRVVFRMSLTFSFSDECEIVEAAQ